MNEIANIHLGRQAYRIAVDAHKALEEYLRDIREQVGPKGKDVVEEVELRMAELLAEHGITGDKVILAKDVAYLKDQLGSPRDFKDDDEEQTGEKEESTLRSKRLYRDTDHAMVAGVAAGLAAYFHIDPVITRLLFAVATITGGWGIPLYIVMWLIVPEAKTSSERLHMRGKAVTVDNLKEVVNQADVKGAAARAGNTVGSIIERVFKLALTIVGVGFMVVGGAMLFGLTTGGVYWWLNHGRLIPFDIFPVGGLETLLVLLAIVVIAVLALLWMLIGLSVVRRKWSLPGWGVAALIGILFASLAVGGALVADTAPKIHDRYQAAYHSDTRTVPAFDKVTIVGERGSTPLLEVVRKTSNDYKVELRSMGHADTSGVTMQETAPGTITVDITKFKSDPDCTSPCVFTGRNTQLLIYAPADKVINITGNGSSWYSVQSQYLNQYVPDSPPPTTPPTP